MAEVVTRVDQKESLCWAFGHRWSLVKAYGRSYMQCEVCGAARGINEQDAARLSDNSTPLPSVEAV